MPTERQYELAEAKKNGKTLILVHRKSGYRYSIGDRIMDFRGDWHTLTHFDHRRVYVRNSEGGTSELFPGVFDCEVVIEGEV